MCYPPGPAHPAGSRGFAVSVEIDTFRVFGDNISWREAQNQTIQFARELRSGKALPMDLAITSLTTDMYSERNNKFDESTARSIFMISSSAGRFLDEKILSLERQDLAGSQLFHCRIRYRASILAQKQLFNSELDLKVKASNTLLKDKDQFQLELCPNQDGYLYIFDFYPDNSVAVVYPNRALTNNFLKKNESWKQSLEAVAFPDREITIETLYFVFSTVPIAGLEAFGTNESAEELVFSGGTESWILFQKWLGRSDPARRVEKMLQLHIIR
jgi:hypothetical protein